MRRTLVMLALGAALAAAPASAGVSATQPLPAAACNQGTTNAHESAPETTGSGKETPGHEAIPGTENVSPCGHG